VLFKETWKNQWYRIYLFVCLGEFEIPWWRYLFLSFYDQIGNCGEVILCFFLLPNPNNTETIICRTVRKMFWIQISRPNTQEGIYIKSAEQAPRPSHLAHILVFNKYWNTWGLDPSCINTKDYIHREAIAIVHIISFSL
jgi:hypothetical protein